MRVLGGRHGSLVPPAAFAASWTEFLAADCFPDRLLSRLELGGQSYTIGTWIESFGSAGPKPDLEFHGQSDARLHPFSLNFASGSVAGRHGRVPGVLV